MTLQQMICKELMMPVFLQMLESTWHKGKDVHVPNYVLCHEDVSYA
jgi:hypothetical protein